MKKLTYQWDPESYAGFEMRQCEMTGALTVSVGTKVQEYAFMLGVEEAKHESITKGDWDELRLMEDQEGELSVEQRLVRSATGALGWLADIYLDAKLFAHKLLTSYSECRARHRQLRSWCTRRSRRTCCVMCMRGSPTLRGGL